MEVDIDIGFHNHTSDNNIVVLIFARHYPIPLTEETFKMAWKVMMVPSMGNVKFTYPTKNKISAFYYNGSNRVSVGPHHAEPGTTWIASAKEDGSVYLQGDDNALPIPDNGYVIYNQKPTDSNWTGRVLNFALYKGENTLRPLVSKQCRVGNYVTLTTTNVLYFGAVIPSYSMAYQYLLKGKAKARMSAFEAVEFSEHNGLTLLPDAEFTPLSPVDLSQFDGNGLLEVKLVEQPYNGKLAFTAEWISR